MRCFPILNSIDVKNNPAYTDAASDSEPNIFLLPKRPGFPPGLNRYCCLFHSTALILPADMSARAQQTVSICSLPGKTALWFRGRNGRRW